MSGAWTFGKARTPVALRQGWHCMRCGINTHGACDQSTHHRQLRSHADPDIRDNPANLIRLCGSGTTGCHGWVHAHPHEAWRNGWIVPASRDPLATPVRDWRGRWLILAPVDATSRPAAPEEVQAFETDIDELIKAKEGDPQ